MASSKSIPELDRKGLRQFGIVTGAIIAGLFGLLLPWLLDLEFRLWPWVLLGLLAAWGVIAPLTLRPVYRAWMTFGLLMSRVTTPLVLGLVFYLVFTPVALARRLAGKDSMTRRFDDSTSYRVPSQNMRKDSLKRPY